MKKYLPILIAAIMAIFGLCACDSAGNDSTGNVSVGNASAGNASVGNTSIGNSSAGNEASESDGRLRIVATIFPEYDWVMNVLGDNPAGAEVTMLLGRGVDLHSYQPTVADILRISTCDLFIYVGGESDGWVEDALREATNKNMRVINLLDALGDSVKEEEAVEGMQEDNHGHEDKHGHEGDHDHEETHGHEESDTEEIEYDEHVWLSLRNAMTLVNIISETLQGMDPGNAEAYKRNTAAYIGKLGELDGKYKAAVEGSSLRTLLFGDRFPFRYLTDDYGLDYYAAFEGCSAETEASFETITFLAGKVDELGLHAVMTIDGTDHRIAETIVQSTRSKNQTVLTLDSMQSTTSKNATDGTTYLSIMESNLAVLTEALR
jgi:zinc transport system substrate-binding protein